jgi:hypothetical protein
MSAEHMSTIFGIYSAVENRPVIRAWADSEQAAQDKLEALKKSDTEANRLEDEYYCAQLTKGDVESYQEGGFIPKDAG